MSRLQEARPTGAMRITAKRERDWITGEMEIALRMLAATPTMPFQIWLPKPAVVTIQVTLQQHHCFESGGRSRQTGTTTLPPLTIRVDTPATDARSVDKQAFLGYPSLVCGQDEIPLPAAALRQSPVVVMEITAKPLAVDGASGDAAGGDECFWIDVAQDDIAAYCQDGWTSFALMTDQQVDARINALIDHYSPLERTDEQAADTLVKLLYKIKSGLKTPVITAILKRKTKGTRHV